MTVVNECICNAEFAEVHHKDILSARTVWYEDDWSSSVNAQTDTSIVKNNIRYLQNNLLELTIFM